MDDLYTIFIIDALQLEMDALEAMQQEFLETLMSLQETGSVLQNST